MAEKKNIAGLEAREPDNRLEDQPRRAAELTRNGLRVKSDVRCGAAETNGHSYP